MHESVTWAWFWIVVGFIVVAWIASSMYVRVKGGPKNSQIQEAHDQEQDEAEEAPRQFVCTACGFIGEPITTVEGGGCTEGCLWLAGLLPGLIYSLWRQSSRKTVCPNCRVGVMIPADSPRGRQIVIQGEPDEPT